MNTLPVIALGVAVGVDYGIYLFERMYHYVKYDGLSIEKSYSEKSSSKRVSVNIHSLVTSVAVFCWYFSGFEISARYGITFRIYVYI